MEEYLKAGLVMQDVARLKTPAKAQWEIQESQVKPGKESGPFVSDELTLPSDNPWNSFLRFSAVDFLSDGRAVLTSLSGEVWIVGGLEDGSATLTWKRFATGLFPADGSQGGG